MSGIGPFGYWFIDEFGLPAYEYICNHELDSRAAYFTTRGYSTDHWHQLGNDRLNALAHNDGSVEVVESTRGLQWLTRRDPKRWQMGGGIAIVEEKTYTGTAWSDLFSQANYESGYRRVFGTGYFRKTATRNDMKLDHVIYTPFSDDPVIISELSVTNNSDYFKYLILYDYWGIELESIIASLIYFDRERKKFSRSRLLNLAGKLLKLMATVSHRAPDQVKNSFSSKFEFDTKYLSYLKAIVLKPKFRKGGVPSKDEPSSRNYYPKPLFLSVLEGLPTRVIVSAKELLDRNGRLQPHIASFRSRVTSKDFPCLCLGVDVPLRPKEQRKFTFIFGYADEEEITTLIDKYKLEYSSGEAATSPSIQAPFTLLKKSSEAWGRHLLDFTSSDETYSWLASEAKWHSYYLRSATLYDEYFENHLLPQGGAYNYLQGLQGAPRDFMLFTIPMTYLEPRLARQMLEYTMRLMTSDGRIPYMTHGFGMTGGALVHKHPSDLPLFFLWGLTEYVFATRDFEFLNKSIPFYPKSSGASSTVYDRVKLAVGYLLNEVGIGEHGLIKAGDGDWNDGISTMLRNRGKFVKEGESMFNSALALYVLPRISLLFEKQQDKEYSDMIENTSKALHEACLMCWNGKWFYRGWNGSGQPIGDKNIFLEPLTLLLISKVIPEDQAKQLTDSIYDNLDKPSPFGQNIVFPPVRTLLNYLENGWDVNGGIWFAMNFLLAWGYSKYDTEKAWNALIKNSLKHHADLYPDIWYGIWSGPDAFNAFYASRPGETYYHIATPTTDFPVMNLNLHANFLTALLKLAGIEPTLDGLTIAPAIPLKEFSLKTPIVEIRSAERVIEGFYFPQSAGDLTLRVRIPRDWGPKGVECLVDDLPSTFRIVEELGIAEVQVKSGLKGFRFKLTSTS